MIKTVRAKNPAEKTIANSKVSTKQKSLALPKEKRIQTAEGWKRTRKAKKA